MAKPSRSRLGRTEQKAGRERAVAPAGKPAAGEPLRPISRPAPRSAAPTGLSPDAIGLFQKGATAVQRHAYAEAADLFRSLLERHPDERAILDRARVYLELCSRELKRKPVAPRTLEERVTAATAALNDGDEARAESLARAVVTENPHHDLALYLLAVVQARRGHAGEAMSMLSQAVAVRPEVRAQARFDADFEPLRGLEAFQALTETPPPANPRRSKRR